MADPNAQLQVIVNQLGNSPIAYRNRLNCMNGTMVKWRDDPASDFFNSAPQATVGQVCRGVMEAAADNSANGNTGGRDLLAPFRQLVDFSSTNPNPQRNQAALALVNGLVDGSRRVYPNSNGLPVQLDGQGKTYPLTTAAALEASFTKTVSEYLAGTRGVPNRITAWDDAQVTSAVETCVRGRDTLRRCDAVGFEVAAIYIQRRTGQAATR